MEKRARSTRKKATGCTIATALGSKRKFRLSLKAKEHTIGNKLGKKEIPAGTDQALSDLPLNSGEVEVPRTSSRPAGQWKGANHADNQDVGKVRPDYLVLLLCRIYLRFPTIRLWPGGLSDGQRSLGNGHSRFQWRWQSRFGRDQFF